MSRWGCVQSAAVTNRTAVNTHVSVSVHMFSFLSDKYQGAAFLSYTANLFNFIRHYHTVLRSALSPAAYKGSSCSTLSPHVGSSVFLTSAVLVGTQGYLTVALTRISLTTSNGEHIFVCLLVIYASFRIRLFESFSQILIGLFCLAILLWEFFMCSEHKPFVRFMFYKYFLPVYGLLFFP